MTNRAMQNWPEGDVVEIPARTTDEPLCNVITDAMLQIMKENMPESGDQYHESDMLWGHIWQQMQRKAIEIVGGR